MTDSTWSKQTKLIVLIILLLSAVALAVLLAPLLYALLIAALLAYLLDPLVGLLIRRTRLTRPWAAAVVFFISILLLIGIPALLGSVAVTQFERIRTELLEVAEAVIAWAAQPIAIVGYRIYPGHLLDDLGQATVTVISAVPLGSFSVISDVTTNILLGLVVLISVYHLLKDGYKIKSWLIGFIPDEYCTDVERLLDELTEIWGVFLRVQLLIFVVLAALMGSGTFLVILLFRSGWLGFSPLVFILLLILVYAGAQQVDNLWLRPQLMGQRLQLHPGLVFAGLTGALVVSGVLGALLIVPLMASARVMGYYIYCQLFDLPPWDGPDDLSTEVPPPSETLDQAASSAG